MWFFINLCTSSLPYSDYYNFMTQRIFFKQLLLLCILLFGGIIQLVSQDKIEGFWDCSIDYHCGWGMENSEGTILLSPSFNQGYTGIIMGGELIIHHPFDNDDFSFEISGQSECFRTGKLKYSRFAETEYLSGDWFASGGNNAMWKTGLCCNGRLELRRKIKKIPPIASNKKDKKTAKELKQKIPEKEPRKFNGKLEAGEIYILKNVLFDLSSDELLPGALDDLSKLYEILNTDKEMVIQLEGHTDIIGSHKNNMRLSKKRVKATKKQLTQRGIASNRIKLKWYGDTRPLITSGSVEERKTNRRVELSVLKTK